MYWRKLLKEKSTGTEIKHISSEAISSCEKQSLVWLNPRLKNEMSTSLGWPNKNGLILLIAALSVLLNECIMVASDPVGILKEQQNIKFPEIKMRSLSIVEGRLRKPERGEPEIMPCGTIRTLLPNEEMQIESPNFSQKMNYPNSLTCEWKFQFPSRMAKLSCPNFLLTEFLCFDSLQIQGANGIMNRYCGTNAPNDLVISEEAHITFRTSAFFGNIGFRCSIIGLDEEPEIEEPVEPITPTTTCLCGIGYADKKVVMGIEAEVNEFPWQAGLVRKNGTRPFCGGSLINDRYILTAAHCVVGRTPYNLEIILNVHNTEVGHEGNIPIRRSVEAIIPHRRYTSRLDYDAALIKIGEPIDISRTPPVCLPQLRDRNSSYADLSAVVTGWGLTAENGELSPVLRKAIVNTMSNDECRTKYASITERMLCAAAPGTDACQGDSGGPLIYESIPGTKKYTQIGLVSWGIGCARPEKPGVYTRVSEILNWIFKTTSEGSFCSEIPPKFIGSVWHIERNPFGQLDHFGHLGQLDYLRQFSKLGRFDLLGVIHPNSKNLIFGDCKSLQHPP